ncbi:MAG: (d)CMP kinase [Thermodesulfobacteriota bacterium]|nr:(d)CMP kinase [Thermodesulfobacteriota bacterium]
MKTKTITIDGPAGSGKTTVSRILAEKLGYIYVDTGSLYRGVAFEVDESGIDWQDDAALNKFLSRINIEPVLKKDSFALLSSGRDITAFIRSDKISMLASAVSAKLAVRASLLEIQKNIAKKNNAVFEGRDMGTIVFPNADFKFFLFADLKIRALRRYKEMGKTGHILADVETSMAKRDKNDSQRKEAPLKPAIDAIMVDSTDLTIDKVVGQMLLIINR